MDSLSAQKIKQNTDRALELVFFAPNCQNQGRQFDMDEQFEEIREGKQVCILALKTEINTELIDYKHHYIKDIESNFPDVELTHLMVCPKMIDDDWRIEKAQEWKIQHLSYPQSVSNWFPVFYSRANSRQYFEQQLQLIAVILQTDNQYEGFIGYVPVQLRVFDIVYALALFFGVAITSKTLYLTHLECSCGSILQLKKLKVKDLANNYLKIYSHSNGNQQLAYKVQKKQRDLLDDLLDQQPIERQQQSIIPYNVQNLQTNHAATQVLWGSQIDNDAQTCFEPSNQVRKKLIALKSEQEIQKIKNRAKMLIMSPKIEIPRDSEEEMESKLNGLSFQLQKYLKC